MTSSTLLVDLHMHTRCSDGVWDVARLLDEVRDRSLDLFCISDHDSLEAYPLPADLAGRAIWGLEVDTHHEGRTVHILAYGVSRKDAPLMQTLRDQRARRTDRMQAMIGALATCGVDLCLDDVQAQAHGSSSLGRPHLARALVAAGAVETVQEAFDRYLGDNSQAYVALERLTAALAIDLIHRSGGVAIAAHPARLHNQTDLHDMIGLGLDGIEIVHPSADEVARERLTDIARQHDLLMTGGTDFHAPVEGRPIGIPFPAREIERLRAAIDSRSRQ